MSKVAHDISTRVRTVDVFTTEGLDFESLQLSQPLLNGLKLAGFYKPSPIQLKAIPIGRCGLDLIVQAKAGTGKTCVFAVVALEFLRIDVFSPQVLILAPTREIALQIHEVIEAISKPTFESLQCSVFIGGLSLKIDKMSAKSAQIIVGTPGRIQQLIELQVLKTSGIRLLVLDEADKLLDDKFTPSINWIVSTLPESKQIIATSATYPEELACSLSNMMRDPTCVRISADEPILKGVHQWATHIRKSNTLGESIMLKVELLTELLSSVTFNQCLAFSNLHSKAEDISSILNSKNWPCTFISGSQTQIERNLSMKRLKTFQARVLLCTDLLARGIDLENVDLVVNIDVPRDWETYLHRVGRAGRFGTIGACVTFVEDSELFNFNSIIQKLKVHVAILPDSLPSDLISISNIEVKAFSSSFKGKPQESQSSSDPSLSLSPSKVEKNNFSLTHAVQNSLLSEVIEKYEERRLKPQTFRQINVSKLSAETVNSAFESFITSGNFTCPEFIDCVSEILPPCPPLKTLRDIFSEEPSKASMQSMSTQTLHVQTYPSPFSHQQSPYIEGMLKLYYQTF